MDQEYFQAEAAASKASSMKSYVQLKTRLLDCIDDFIAIIPENTAICSELREKLDANVFNLVVVGQFKRGKTYLINALMGEEILPVAVVPLTSIVTVLKYGESVNVQVVFNDGNTSEIQVDQIQNFATETGNPKNVKGVREVLITYPSSYLKDGVRLIDTPGVGSIYLHNTDVAYQYLPKSDAALFLLSVDQPVGKAEMDFLSDVRQYSNKIFFLLNKIDYLSEEEVSESIDFSRKAIREVMGEDVRIFPVSAKLALKGKLESSNELLLKSNLPAFSEVLTRFLLLDKGKVLLSSVIHNLLRILSQSRLQLELEQKSLETPLHELEEKLRAFEEKKGEILNEKKNFDIMLDGEVNRFVKTVLDEDLTALKKEILPKMEQGLDDFYAAHSDLSLKELNDILESYVVQEVQRAYNAWHGMEEEKVAKAFDEICEGFLKRINDILDDLLMFSSELFSIPFEVIKVKSVWSSESNFYYKLQHEPVGLDLLTDSLTQVLPGYISKRFEKFRAYVFRLANRMIFNKRKRHMLETIEMQAGRMRSDFLTRLNRGKHGFRKEVLQRIDAMVDGISGAIEKGMDAKTRGEKQSEEIKKVLMEKLQAVEEGKKKLIEIAENVQSV
ncbi:dynamin family protein [Desulforhabdus amnigena]|uniref:Dynamin N-terminal domain-containing protein n=1 Tax=Desulforhabdus amnigena TaxID=40218 RepID=A0A9W6FVS1_9BACT|nr:dynamin family protein [Desulforhabdus amnigena]GLI35809.1 hypothetical protein DAMNIGENAA_32420 [Desulforhabdus amnigena]